MKSATGAKLYTMPSSNGVNYLDLRHNFVQSGLSGHTDRNLPFESVLVADAVCRELGVDLGERRQRFGARGQPRGRECKLKRVSKVNRLVYFPRGYHQGRVHIMGEPLQPCVQHHRL